MRRLVTLGIVMLAVLGLAACGTRWSGSGAPLDTELSYLPPDTPLVMTIVTDPNSAAVKNAQALVRRFPVASFGEAALISKLQQRGVNYDTEIRPLFGNPVVFALPNPAMGGSLQNQSLVVWITKDANALSSVVKKFFPGIQPAGTHDGATLYQSPTAAIAVDGPTLIVASKLQAVASALDRHASGGGISQSQYAHALGGLPQDALIQAFGTLTGVLSTPRAAKARQVPWVAALRGYAASITATGTGISVDFKLDTTGAALTKAQLPIASGSSAPGLAGSLPIVLALRDPAQVASFVEGVEQATHPAEYAAFLRRQASARRKTGADINSLLSLMTGDLVVDSDGHTTLARVAVTNPATARQVLAKLATIPDVLPASATTVTQTADGFYLFKKPHQTTAVGVVGNELVAGNTAPAALRAFASAPAIPASGAPGALAFRVALPELLTLALKRAPSQTLKTILSSLGDITGWASASPEALTGDATLAIKGP